MSNCPELSELLVALEKISWSDLKLLAPHLSRHNLFPLLEDIERDYQDKERFVHAFRKWLERDLDASWENVVSALRVISKNVLALEVEKKYCAAVKSKLLPLGTLSDMSLPPDLVSATHSAVEQASSPPSQLRDQETASSATPSSSTAVAVSSSLVLASDLSGAGSLDVACSNSGTSRLQEISDEATCLQERFVNVLINTKVCFMVKVTDSKDFLTKFKVTLTTLPLSKRHEHLIFLRNEKHRIKKADDVDEIFDILDPYWNYVDYEFLNYIIIKFGTTELKVEMKEYIADLEWFEKKTSVYDFDAAVADKRKFPVHLLLIAYRLARDPKKFSLYEVRQFKNAVVNKSTLNEYAVFLKGVSYSSIIITFAVPPEAHSAVLYVLDKHFISEYNIESVQILGPITAERQTTMTETQGEIIALNREAGMESNPSRVVLEHSSKRAMPLAMPVGVDVDVPPPHDVPRHVQTKVDRSKGHLSHWYSLHQEEETAYALLEQHNVATTDHERRFTRRSIGLPRKKGEKSEPSRVLEKSLESLDVPISVHGRLPPPHDLLSLEHRHRRRKASISTFELAMVSSHQLKKYKRSLSESDLAKEKTRPIVTARLSTSLSYPTLHLQERQSEKMNRFWDTQDFPTTRVQPIKEPGPSTVSLAMALLPLPPTTHHVQYHTESSPGYDIHSLQSSKARSQPSQPPRTHHETKHPTQDDSPPVHR